MTQAGSQPETRQQRPSAILRRSSGAAGDHLRQHDVLQRAELGQQMMELVDEAYRVPPDGGADGIGQPAGIASLDQYRAAVGAVEQPRYMQQRRFTGTGGRDQGND